ncbi:MAG: beta-phosphoglucomutase family hydrolase [Deltaproteobacteria bacterium]|jgi:beta-phosphoglucomutase|nr:beta-phosphoglucomutase family hydrolase [Deltaproteobacteria bacterium]
MSFKAAIFDLDGVVVNTVPIHFKSWKRMFEEYGKSFTFEDYKQKVDGIPRMDGARAILTDLSEEELDKAATKKQGYFMEYLETEEIPRFDTTTKLISDLQKDGKKVAVISSSRNCPHILKRIGIFDSLDAVISGADITIGKPDPQIFLMAAEKVGATPDECVVFEDAVLGVEAAKNGNMRCIGIDRYEHPERLSKANIIVTDLGEIDIDKIKSLF